jgi:NAD(P)-dependent dehydrogenase (short-subunit alcohol dehydrogenase family)
MSHASRDLQRRTAFVTGGARGIGLETARGLAAAE